MLRWNKWIGFGPTKGELTQLKKGKELGVPFWIYRSEGEYADKPGVIYKAKRILNISDLKPVKNFTPPIGFDSGYRSPHRRCSLKRVPRL